MEQKETAKLLAMEAEHQATRHRPGRSGRRHRKALRRSRADLKDPRRPIGSFIFLGPTGVGKTLLAKHARRIHVRRSDALIQIDMTEYMEKFTASRLIGSPPGYVGYEEGGQLTEAVRRRPYSVVLFDEIEKAHPDVMHLLLQILEEGKLTDSFGRKIDFRNTIIIMTSNVGAELIKRQTTMGFGAPRDEANYDVMREKILEEAKRVFKPEFLNRLDDIIVFHTLEKPDLIKIVDLEVNKVKRASAAEGNRDRARREGARVPDRERLRPELRRASDAPRGGALSRRSARRRVAQRQRESGRSGPGDSGKREARFQCRRTAQQRRGKRT